MKATSDERLLGKLLKLGLVTPLDENTTAHHLTPAGYQAVGAKPPRAVRARTSPEQPADAGSVPSASKRGTKTALILGLLGRGR